MDETARSLFLDRSIRHADGQRASTRAPARAPEAGHEDPADPTWEPTRAFVMWSLAATFLWLASGAILVSASDLSSAICSVALACALAGIVVLILARRRLRRALLDLEVARGTPKERAEVAADAALERIVGEADERRV
jgi:hypothetical protein